MKISSTAATKVAEYVTARARVPLSASDVKRIMANRTPNAASWGQCPPEVGKRFESQDFGACKVVGFTIHNGRWCVNVTTDWSTYTLACLDWKSYRFRPVKSTKG